MISVTICSPELGLEAAWQQGEVDDLGALRGFVEAFKKRVYVS